VNKFKDSYGKLTEREQLLSFCNANSAALAAADAHKVGSTLKLSELRNCPMG